VLDQSHPDLVVVIISVDKSCHGRGKVYSDKDEGEP